MAVTATTVAAATTMLAAVATVFLTLLLCFYVFLCAKRYRGEALADRGVAAWLRFLLRGGSVSGVSSGGGGGGGAGAAVDGAAAWRGLDEKSVAKLPRRVVAGGEPLDCAVCIAELVAGETARVLPRCGHGFHVDCVDPWLRSRSTCPLCRCPAVEEPPAVPAPEADADSPNFPTNVLFFGSQDEVITGRAQHHQPASETTASTQSQEETGFGAASPPRQPPHPQDTREDIEMCHVAGESHGR